MSLASIGNGLVQNHSLNQRVQDIQRVEHIQYDSFFSRIIEFAMVRRYPHERSPASIQSSFLLLLPNVWAIVCM